MVYNKLEEATRGTPYAPSIKPFQRAKDGRGAWFALVNQYAGKDKWQAEIKRYEKLMHTSEWKGQSNFTLERFIAQHRNAYVSMQAAAEHVTYQLPNEHSRVGFVLDAIQSSDAGLQAAMASIKTDQAVDGLRNDFEASATHLLPYDPVQKKRSDHAGGKRGAADISDMTAEEANVSSFGTKTGIGSTGVALRYHTNAEYKELPRNQKDELREWRNGQPKGSGFSGKSGKSGANFSGKSAKKFKTNNTAKAIAAAVEKKVAEKMKSMEKDKADEGEAEAYIMSIFQKHSEKARISGVKSSMSSLQISDIKSEPKKSEPSLKSILERVAHNGKS
jgi:hypothetical protein